jgi:lipooligosaccharide transport system ATP-binding protein
VVELRFQSDDQSTFADGLDGIGDRVEVLPDRVLLYADDGDEAASAVTGRGLAPTSVLVRRSSLEDVFLHLTGRTLVE